MICDNWNKLGKYAVIVPEAEKMLREKIAEMSSDAPAGKVELIPERLSIMIFHNTTREAAADTLETHAEFADIQMLLKGREDIYYASCDSAECTRKMADDYALFSTNGVETSRLTMFPGNFVLFLPGEGHMGGFGDGGAVVKTVIKIHRSLLILK